MAECDYTPAKKCKTCLQDKPWSDYYAQPSTGKPRPQCKDCLNAARRKNKVKPSALTQLGKICSRCKIDKPLSDFGTRKKGTGLLRAACKACRSALHAEWNAKNAVAVREHAKKWRAANSGVHREYTSEWKKQNPERAASQNRNRRAIRSASEGSHTVADIERLFKLQRGCCAACFKPLGSAYHVDHREALSRGGSNNWTNLQLLHPTCNLRKNAKDPIDFMQANGYLL